MKKISLSLLAIFLCVQFAAAQKVPVQEIVLDNGMRLLLVPRKGDPNVAAGNKKRIPIRRRFHHDFSLRDARSIVYDYWLAEASGESLRYLARRKIAAAAGRAGDNTYRFTRIILA